MGQSTQTMHMLTKTQAFYDESHKTALGYQIPFYLSQARRKVPTLYDSHNIVKTPDALSITDTEETLELAEESRLKMLAKQNDPSLKEKKVNIAPVDYVALNKLSEHFVKHFVPKKQLSAEQAFWLPILQPVSEKPPVPSELVLKKEIPRELPSISLVKDSFHKMKVHVNKFDETITFHTKITGNKIGSWGVEHIKRAFKKDVKPFAQTLKEYFKMFEHDLCKELKEMKVVFNQMETEVAKCSVDKKYFEIEKKELSLDNDRLLENIICQDVMSIVMHTNDHYSNVLPANSNSLDHDNSALELLKHENDRFMDEYNETLVLKAELAKKNDMIEKLQAQLKAKNVSIVKLKEHIANIKEKNVVVSVQNVHNSNVVTSKVYKLDLPPLSPCIKNNMAVHVDYLKHTQENADILCEFATCPSLKHVSDKLVAVTPMNKTRKVSSTEASRSKPMSNKKKDRIMQTSCSNKKTNKVEDQPRNANSSLNNVNRVSKTVCNANVKHFVLNANSELIYAICHEFMFDAINDLCVSDYLNDVHARVKSKSVKSRYAKSKKKKMWKPTVKVYTNVGYSWKPTRRTFTIVGNTCPFN
ncbi:hypothetical protein Tco_0846184 [Tanacetum coccineum]